MATNIYNDYKNLCFFDLRLKSSKAVFDLSGLWSYPSFILIKSSNKKKCCWLHLVLPMIYLQEKKLTALMRPKAIVITEINSSNILSYGNFRNGYDYFPDVEWNSPIGMYPFNSIKELNKSDIAKLEIDLIKKCISESEKFIDNLTLSNEFSSSWIQLTHPALLPYIEKIAPEFFKALRLPDPLENG